MTVDPFVEQLDGHQARRVPGMRATKVYRCPECGNDIAVGVGHVVVWPEDQVDMRRHWHLHCWRVACRRGRLA